MLHLKKRMALVRMDVNMNIHCQMSSYPYSIWESCYRS